MTIHSLDNVSEADGLTNLVTLLTRITEQPLTDKTRVKVVAILPEYRADGMLDRLDVITVPTNDPGPMSEGSVMLQVAATMIVEQVQRERAAKPDPVPVKVKTK